MIGKRALVDDYQLGYTLCFHTRPIYYRLINLMNGVRSQSLEMLTVQRKLNSHHVQKRNTLLTNEDQLLSS
jgi:hypothetical protein